MGLRHSIVVSALILTLTGSGVAQQCSFRQYGAADGLQNLQTAAKKAKLPGLAIAACSAEDPSIGYTHRTHYNIIPGYSAGSQKHPYSELVETHQKA